MMKMRMKEMLKENKMKISTKMMNNKMSEIVRQNKTEKVMRMMI